jgi:RNA polymerase-binding transcription factor DksA
LPQGTSLTHCEECDSEIPQARQKAIPGVRFCVQCQTKIDQSEQHANLYNRRGSKSSQLK